MRLLEDIPAPETFLNFLDPILGSEENGIGINGALKLLKNLDSINLAANFASSLDDTFAGIVPQDISDLIGGILGQFDQTLKGLPSDPTQLVAPLNDKLDTLKNLASLELSNKLFESIGAFQNIQSLLPPDMRSLITGAANGLSQLKKEFISGSFGELREWSQSVTGLYEEIKPLLDSGSGSVEDRLIAYLGNKLSDLVNLILPQKKGLFDIISSQLNDAISVTHVEKVLQNKSDLVNKINQVKIEFENGNFTNTAHLQSAIDSFNSLVNELEGIASSLGQTLTNEIASMEGMIRALEKQFDDFEAVEIVDLGNIKDKFEAAFQSVEEALKEIKLDSVKETVDGVFTKINEVIDGFDLKKMMDILKDIQERIRSVMEELDGALFEVIASVKNIFLEIKEVLNDIALQLGSYDEEGKFQFNVQKHMEESLTGLKEDLDVNLATMLKNFKEDLRSNFEKINEILGDVENEINSVTEKVKNSLTSINRKLQDLDVAGKLEDIHRKLDGMLSGLGEIDFDPVVDPVITQINEMRDELKSIDLSSMNEALVTALKLAVKVVQEIDFPEKITKALLNQIDQILEIPKEGLNGIEERVEDAIEKLGALEPDIILKPLDDVFKPVNDQLNALDLEKLIEPLDEWHGLVKQELEKISPQTLLEPVIEIHDQLVGSFNSISPEALIEPLSNAIDSVKSELEALDFSSIADEVREAIESVQNLMNEISPEKLFQPLVNAFDKIVNALDRFKPADLLEPFSNVFDGIISPLDNLTQEHINLIQDAFACVMDLITAFDPEHIIENSNKKYLEVQNLLQQVNVGQIIAELKEPYDSMIETFNNKENEAKNQLGDNVTSFKENLEKLNLLGNDKISRSAKEFQDFQNRLKNAFSHPTPPSELLDRFKKLKPKLELIVPTWIKDDMTPVSIKKAFQQANPINITDEVNALYDVFKEQLNNFDPRIIQENVKETFEKLKGTFETIDPEQIVKSIQGVISDLVLKLNAIDFEIIVNELQDIVEDVETIINSLDPSSVIKQLESLTGDVMKLADELKPSDLLKELFEPSDTEPALFDKAKDIVAKFDPNNLKEPIRSIFEEIRGIISAIDIGVILEPLAERLKDLRNELEKGLKRTETAFGGMLAAISV